MALVVIGVILLLLKLAAIGPVAGWSWFVVLAPFPCALVWWAISDMSGRTARKAMEREDARKDKRRQDAMERLGNGPRRDGKARRTARSLYSNLSSTAPLLALEALFANFASTPRV